MAEIEFSIYRDNALIPYGDEASLIQEIALWERNRNKAKATVDWQFTTEDARIKRQETLSIN